LVKEEWKHSIEEEEAERITRNLTTIYDLISSTILLCLVFVLMFSEKENGS